MGSGPPIVLIHGLGASLEQWQPLMNDLGLQGFRTLALDLLGHGASGHPEGRSHYHIEVIFRQLVDWIDSLGMSEPLIFIGHSLGGYLSLLLGLRRQAQARGLILINPYFRPDQLSLSAKISQINSDLSTGIFKRTPVWTISNAMRLSELNGQSYSRQDRDQMALDFKRADPDVIRIPESITDLGPRLYGLDLPIAIIWGNRDLTLNPSSFSDLAALLPHASETQVPEGGHMPHMARPDYFGRILSEELQRILHGIPLPDLG